MRRRPAPRLLAAAAAAALLLGGGLYWFDHAAHPSDYSQAAAAASFAAGTRVPVTISPGASLRTIAAALTEASVVASQGAFVQVATESPDAREIQPGTYRMLEHLPAALALQALLGRGPGALAMVDVPAQAKVKDVLAAVAARTPLTRASLEQAAGDPAHLGVPGGAVLEGWIGPGRFDVAASDTAASVLSRMVTVQRAVLEQAGVAAAAARQGRSVQDLVVIASLVQAEGIPDDYPKVAAVIDNRLAAGMKLQMDSSVNYGLGISSLNLSGAQLASGSPYNTYTNLGLPPGPIGTPSRRALAAAADPAAGEWLYFVLAAADGHSHFSRTYAEHQQAVAAAKAAGLF